MKRIVIFVVALACGFCVQAQSKKDLERVKQVRDSVISVLDQHRDNYATNKEVRKTLSPVILALEERIAELQQQYNKLLADISAMEGQDVIAEYEEAVKKANAVKKQKAAEASVEATESKPTSADNVEAKSDLVTNDHFSTQLKTDSNYQTLQNAQKKEVEIKTLVARYFELYAELKALQEQYKNVKTKKLAEEVAVQFNTKNGDLDELNSQILSAWTQVYDDKIYLYDLLMEREGNNAMLAFSTEAASAANSEVDKSKGKYHSDALVNYFTRKKMITEYELRMASKLMLAPSIDSLNTVMSELKNQDFRLAKLSLPRRNFICYENIVVKTTPIYNSANPVPQTKVEDYGTVYRICILSTPYKASISMLRGVAPVSYTRVDDEYLYFAGGFQTEQEAKNGVAQLKKLGFKEPTVAVWVDGKYYPTLEDMRRSESQYEIHISGVDMLSDEIKNAILSHHSESIITRVGSAFVAGAFDSKSAAEAVAADVKAANADVEVTITKKQ